MREGELEKEMSKRKNHSESPYIETDVIWAPKRCCDLPEEVKADFLELFAAPWVSDSAYWP